VMSHNLGNCVRWKVLLQQGKIKPRPDPGRRVEGSTDLSPKFNLGEGNVCRTDFATNLPNRMGIRGSTTSNTPEQTTRNSTTFWESHTTSGAWGTRRGLRQIISTCPISTGLTPTRETRTKPRSSAIRDKPTQSTTPENKGASRPPPSKRQQNPCKGNLPGKRSANIQHAGSPKISRQHRPIHDLLEQRPQRMRLDGVPPQKSRWTCPTGGDHRRICRRSL
jgi:hypothetical protein